MQISQIDQLQRAEASVTAAKKELTNTWLWANGIAKKENARAFDAVEAGTFASEDFVSLNKKRHEWMFKRLKGLWEMPDYDRVKPVVVLGHTYSERELVIPGITSTLSLMRANPAAKKESQPSKNEYFGIRSTVGWVGLVGFSDLRESSDCAVIGETPIDSSVDIIQTGKIAEEANTLLEIYAGLGLISPEPVPIGPTVTHQTSGVQA